MSDGSESGEKIFLFRTKDFRDGFALAADDGKVALGHPEQAVEQALAVEDLARGDGEDPAGGVFDRFLAPVAGGIERELLFRQQQRLDLAEIAEVFLGQDQAGEHRLRLADQPFGPFAGG